MPGRKRQKERKKEGMRGGREGGKNERRCLKRKTNSKTLFGGAPQVWHDSWTAADGGVSDGGLS